MFTGLAQGQGELIFLRRSEGQARMGIRPLFLWDKPLTGESVAVNGVCLTVEHWDAAASLFTAYVSAESLSASNLGESRVGSRLNLERALALGDRLGGHIVSGHVDGVARVESVSEAGDSRRVRLSCDEVWSGQIIAKGSVALDGISLTVNQCGPGFLEVNIIPETWRKTALSGWKQGCRVNMETDVIGKYVLKLLGPYGGGTPARRDGEGLSFALLRENGF